MKSTFDIGMEKEYSIPTVEIVMFSSADILCMSTEGNDNDFDAGDLGDF
jgi:hypothetical protein